MQIPAVGELQGSGIPLPHSLPQQQTLLILTASESSNLHCHSCTALCKENRVSGITTQKYTQLLNAFLLMSSNCILYFPKKGGSALSAASELLLLWAEVVQ